jgi:hypothetical protein
MSDMGHSFPHAVPRTGGRLPLALPVTDLLATAITYRDCASGLDDPFGASVLGLFASLHRRHADELLPHAEVVGAPQPNLRGDLNRMRNVVQRDGQRWIDEFIASERALQSLYRITLRALGPSGSPLTDLLLRHQATLNAHLQQAFAGMSRVLERISDAEASPSPPLKGD